MAVKSSTPIDEQEHGTPVAASPAFETVSILAGFKRSIYRLMLDLIGRTF